MLRRPVGPSLQFGMPFPLASKSREDGSLPMYLVHMRNLLRQRRAQCCQVFQVYSLSSRHTSFRHSSVTFEAYVMIGVKIAIVVGLHDICDLDLIIGSIKLNMHRELCIVTMDV